MELGVESYIAVPLLRRDGSHFGTLCALDPNPSRLSESHFDVFRLLALLISYELEADDEHQKLEVDLVDARDLVKARERLVAILSHDLRTPLTSVLIGTQQLASTKTLNAEEQRTALAVVGSARRATRMIADLLDFTRAGLAGGMPVIPQPTDLSMIVTKVVSEIRAASPDHEIRIAIEGDCRGTWDADRAAQVVSNLVNNAIEHGVSEPVIVRLLCRDADVILEVENAGTPIPPGEVADMFSPFRQGSTGSRSGGLGLGLYIAQQIMHAHGGTVELLQSKGRITLRAIWPRAQSRF